MFTGILQGIATIRDIQDRPGLRTFTLAFPQGFDRGLQIGASVSVDGVCLTVTTLHGDNAADFDVMLQSLSLTTLSDLKAGDRVNVERAAVADAEVGGHTLSGHVDFTASIAAVRLPQNNRVWRLRVPAPWMRYLFAKGYIALSGASLTLAEVHREADGAGWFEVWLIPETLRITTFGQKAVGDRINVEIDRQTQIVVDTIREVLDQRLGPLQGAIDALLRARSVEIDVDTASMARSPTSRSPRTALSPGGNRSMATKKKKPLDTPNGVGPHDTPNGVGPHDTPNGVGPHDTPNGVGPHDTPNGVGPHKKTKKKPAKKKKKVVKKKATKKKKVAKKK
jgi:riboflavin synthase